MGLFSCKMVFLFVSMPSISLQFLRFVCVTRPHRICILVLLTVGTAIRKPTIEILLTDPVVLSRK
jgi:hypothetical protein